MKRIGLSIALCAALAGGVITGCTNATTASASNASANASAPSSMQFSSGSMAPSGGMSSGGAESTIRYDVTASVFSDESAIDTTDMFTDRDKQQAADTSSAKQITLKSGEDVTISEEGVYVVSGTATDSTITVTAADTAKVQIVLNNANITNTDSAAINVTSADKVFVTTAAGSTNTLEVTGAFATSEEANIDGVIFSKDDLVLNGQGTLVVKSSANGIVGKDDVKVTGGTYEITAEGHGIQAKDSLCIADGTFTINAGTDGIHCENSDDSTKGTLYIGGGTFNITAGSDGIAGIAITQIADGNIIVNAAEGIEGTYVQITGGSVDITASDDGINATSKSSYPIKLRIDGGSVKVNMASGDTDALDSNGDLIITGGTVDITGQSPFDFDGTGELTGGTVTVNGQQVTELTNQMMGGMGGRGGQGGQGNMGGRGSMSGQAGQPA